MTAIELASQETHPSPPTRRRPGAFTRLIRKPLGLLGLVVLVALILLAALEPVLSTHPPSLASLEHINAPPGTPGYPLGADQFGQDIWARVLYSIKVSLLSALIGAGVAVVIGTVFGLIAGYIGKRTDSVASWAFNLLMTFPALVLVIVLTPITGGRYEFMMAIFGVFLSPSIFRLVRNLVVGVRNELYVDAARVSGLSNSRILRRHVLYIVRGPIIVTLAFLASAAIGVQAGLAFLGIGSSTLPSFGAMTGAAFANIYVAPIQFVWPSLFLALLNGCLVLLGNAYRDALAEADKAAKPKRGTPAATLEPREPAAATGALTGSGLLTVRDLRVGYPRPDGGMTEVVKGVSLTVEPGEIVGLVGESGSGKTQTAFSILGLLPKQAQVEASTVTLAGQELLGATPRVMRRFRAGVMSYIPQEPMSNLDPSFTIGNQLMEGLRAGMTRREAKARVMYLLERVGIPDPERVFKAYPHEISGGMAQRVLIAGAVASRPKLLIADEPTTALDVTVQAEILDLIRDLQSELGMGVLLVTHNFGVVADLCDRVVVMRSGELVESGPVRDIFHRPSHPYTQELVGAILDEDTVRTDPPASDEEKS